MKLPATTIIMPTGKHKGKALHNVPAGLLYHYFRKEYVTQNKHREVYLYIIGNMQVIRSKKLLEEKTSTDLYLQQKQKDKEHWDNVAKKATEE